jgi:type II secretory pathway component HofQ
MAVQKNWEADHNTTFTFQVQYTEDDEVTPIDLTGATAKMQVRDTKGGSKLAFTLTSPSGGITIDGSTGTITIKATPTQTSKLFYPKSAYDIMVVDTNGNKIKLLEGFITLSRSVTV